MMNAIMMGLYASAMSLNVGLGAMNEELNTSAYEMVKAFEVSHVESVEVDTIELDVFYMYSNEEGSYFLEPNAEYENVIFIDNDTLKEWNVNTDELEHGMRYTGTFDKDGWELFGLEYGKAKQTFKACTVDF